MATRRDYERGLAEMMRREVQAAMGSELAMLRADVAALRSELVEKVGGQLRLERIETTRVIGSDIEALQHELRALMVSRQPADLGSFSLGTTRTTVASRADEWPVVAPVATGPFAPEPFAPQPVAPEPFAPEPLAPEPVAPVPLSPEPLAPEPFAPEPVAPEPSVPEPAGPEPVAPEPPLAEPDVNGDPFAFMPRLRPFTDFDPVQTAPQGDSYAGRRLHDGALSPVLATSEAEGPGTGRHANANGEVHLDTPGGRGRPRRAPDEDDEDEDVLARILHREDVR